MKHSIHAVYDEKAKAYLPPFFLPNAAMAVRVFSDCVFSDDHQFGKHPGDYTLFCLGTFDIETAEFDCSTPRKEFNGLELPKPNR